jgi:hypothetical protein
VGKSSINEVQCTNLILKWCNTIPCWQFACSAPPLAGVQDGSCVTPGQQLLPLMTKEEALQTYKSLRADGSLARTPKRSRILLEV